MIRVSDHTPDDSAGVALYPEDFKKRRAHETTTHTRLLVTVELSIELASSEPSTQEL